MNTPVYDFLEKLNNSDMLRCFMPGHKGKCSINKLAMLYKLDITEIKGADSLFEAEGIIAQSEKNASELFGTASTVYSATGSTLCIQAMLTIMKWEQRKIFAVRNVHRSFLNAVALLDIDVEWIYPEYSGGIMSGEINLDELENILKSYNEKSCVYVTSPDYTGKLADIEKISEICHRYNARLLVDNAHGALLAFLENNIHPINLGADLCCDSAHKMLPSLTGGAYLHTSQKEYAKILKKAMLLFASTSPSYLVMMSLDLCNDYIASRIKSDIKRNMLYISDIKNKFSEKLYFVDGEPFHLTIKAMESGFDGREFADYLREKNVECEYADFEFTVLLMSPVNSESDFLRLADSLEYALQKVSAVDVSEEKFCLVKTQKVMSIRSAVFAESEEISVDLAEGRICAETNVPCPPAIPIAVSGEVITKDIINIYKKYGILSLNVVK